MHFIFSIICLCLLLACGSKTEQPKSSTEVKFEPKIKTIGDVEVKFEPKLKTIGDYDLVAVRVTYKPEKVRVGDEVVFEQEVTNTGTETIPARSYKAELFLNGKLISFDYGTSERAPNTNSTYSMAEGHYHFKPERPGEYHYKFILDRENTLKEKDETNNVIEGKIVVEPNNVIKEPVGVE